MITPFLSKHIYIIFPILLIYLVFLHPLLRSGLIVGSDWIFPYTKDQMIQMGHESWHLWSYRQIPTGTQIPHQNIYLFGFLVGLLGQLGMDGVTFQRLFVITLMSLMYLCFYFSFKKIINNNFAVMLGGLVYVFSPIVFNYFIMGWFFVILFMALAPIILVWSWNYWHTGNLKYPIGLGLLLVVSFVQSQSIYWVPLILLVTWLVSLFEVKYKILIKRGLVALIFILFIMTIGHGSWIYAVSLAKEDYLVSTTTANDIFRFGIVAFLSNQIRGWGSLYNEHFELSYYKPFLFISFLPLSILLYNLTNRSAKNLRNWIIISTILILISPTFYLNRQFIANLPMSNIIRDVSRFILFTQLGLSLAVSIFISHLQNRKIIVVTSFLLLINMHPFWFGRLHTPEIVKLGNSQFSKDQRIRILNLSLDETEKALVDNNSKRSLLLPTGSFLTAINNTQFIGTFTEVADQDAYFSPYTTGFFMSDKSNPFISKFATQYLIDAEFDFLNFIRTSQKYSIDTLYYRQNLNSSFPVDVDSPEFNKNCTKTNYSYNDWSISHICKLENSFPLVYFLNNPQKTENDQILVSDFCDNTISNNCISSKSVSNLQSNFSTFQLQVNDLDQKNSILVSNTTFHPGWKVFDSQFKELNFPHILVNDLVNGWELPANFNDKLTILFYPDLVYQKLTRFALAGLGIISIIWLYLSYKPSKN